MVGNVLIDVLTHTSLRFFGITYLKPLSPTNHLSPCYQTLHDSGTTYYKKYQKFNQGNMFFDDVIIFYDDH